MEYRPIQYNHFEPSIKEQSIFEEAVALIEIKGQKDYLSKVGAFISEHTGVRYILIGKINNDNETVSTLVMLDHQKPLNSYTYQLKNTPCDIVIKQRFCYHPAGVAQAFPDDKELQDLKIESYMGSILLSEENEPIGLIALMDTHALSSPAFAEHLLLLLCSSIEDEIRNQKTQGV